MVLMTTRQSQQRAPWRLKGHVLVSCNCDYGCPCNFNARPTTGKCEGGWTWHVEEGSLGATPLGGLSFSLAVNWPGAIHEGGGEGVFIIDERADAAQRDAIQTLVGGTVGGPWQVLRATIATLHGPRFVPFEFEADDYRSRVRAGDLLAVEMEPVRNPVTKVEVHPRAVLPEGFVFKDGMLGRTATYWVRDGVDFDHSGQYAAFAAVEYHGP